MMTRFIRGLRLPAGLLQHIKHVLLENWIHSAGCGRWIVLSRDTVTHVVTGSEPMV